MIHLAGEGLGEKIRRAREEIDIYGGEGVDGAIIEDYHCYDEELEEVLKKINPSRYNLVLGINSLRHPELSIERANHFGERFVQFDNVLGLEDRYVIDRSNHPEIVVLGGVRFKYTPPTGRSLDEDIAEGKQRCDTIVTTGEGTGIETPITKIISFRKRLGDVPLIVGAGVNSENIYEQLTIADGAIVGSYFKPNGDTTLPVDRKRVKDLMDAVRTLR